MVEQAGSVLPNETGGVLLGYWLQAGVEVVITAMVGPGPRARHRRTTFCPDYDFQEHEIARHYAESGRRTEYLGDWHSHPKGGVGLSRKDRRTLAAIATYAEARAPTPLMAILAGRPRWHFAVWCTEPPNRVLWTGRLIVNQVRIKTFG